MKRSATFSMAVFILAFECTGCTVLYRGVGGNIYEKMTIFSMIILTVFAMLFVPFVSSKVSEKAAARFREVIRGAPILPLPTEELTRHPLFVWDSRRSFRKVVCGEDGTLSESTIVTTNGVDPKTYPAGSWSITAEGILKLSLKVTSGNLELARVSPCGYRLPTLLRLRSGYAQCWFLGEHSLEQVQIACFGYSQTLPPAERLTRELFGGSTVYWATYPCIIPASTDEITVNPELAFGMMRFNEDGTLVKSINNTIEAAPDYQPSFEGSWKVDELLGVLSVSAGLYTTEIILHQHDLEQQSLLIGTTAGNEQWFLHPERAKEDLTTYLALGVHLDPAKRSLFS